ncbi:hypothetical protein DENSPDRAFT_639664 [Dentipellis sp. KUC8613]|nr:hypothetical protein DENSPDRAFT_639664 [Dentipellis sp. KUC8613]
MLYSSMVAMWLLEGRAGQRSCPSDGCSAELLRPLRVFCTRLLGEKAANYRWRLAAGLEPNSKQSMRSRPRRFPNCVAGRFRIAGGLYKEGAQRCGRKHQGWKPWSFTFTYAALAAQDCCRREQLRG